MFDGPKKPDVSTTSHGVGTGHGEGKGDGTGGDTAPKAQPQAGGGAINLLNKMTPSTGKTDRKTVGVGELVDFWVDGTEGKFTASGGSGSSATTNGETTYTWTAPAAGGAVTINFAPKGGGTAPPALPITVVAPKIQIKKTSTYKPAGNPIGAGMKLAVTFLPLDVCFGSAGGVEWIEDNVDATNKKGFFNDSDASHADVKAPSHVAAAARKFNDTNDGPEDHADFSWSQKPDVDGSFDWVIPQSYQINGANKTKIRDITQTCKMSSKGVTTVVKDTETASQ